MYKRTLRCFLVILKTSKFLTFTKIYPPISSNSAKQAVTIEAQQYSRAVSNETERSDADDFLCTFA